MTAFKSIPIVYLSINSFADIRTSYGFQGYHYLKDKVVLLLSLLFDTVSLNIGCLVKLYDRSFFWTHVPNTLIWKIATSITVWGLRANKHAMD